MPSGISRDKIEARAYEIWVEEGKPHGRHDEHWERAAAEFGSSEPAPAAAKPAGRKKATAANGHDTDAAPKAPRKTAATKTAATPTATVAPKAPATKTAAKSAPGKAGAAGDTTAATKTPGTRTKRTTSKA